MRTSSLVLLVCLVFAQQKIPEVREWDYVVLKHGRVLVGHIVEERKSEIVFSPRRNPTLKYPIPRDSIVDIKRRQSPKEAFQHCIKRARKPKTVLETVKWALKYPQIQEEVVRTLYLWCCKGQKNAEFYRLLLFLVRQKAADEGRVLNEKELSMLLDALDAQKSTDKGLILEKASLLLEAGFASSARRILKNEKMSGKLEVKRLLLLGKASLVCGLTEEALSNAEEALKSDPKNAQLLALKARSLLALNKPNDALLCIQQLKESEPLWFKPHALEATALYLKGDLEGAMAALNKAFTLCKPSSDLLCDTAQVLLLQGRVYTALAKLKEAEKTGVNWRIRYLEALCKKVLGDKGWQEALSEAAGMEDAPPFVVWQNAAALFESALYDESEKEAKRALEAGFAPERCWELMARCRLAKGDTNAAHRFALYSLAANPHHHPALIILYRTQAKTDPKRAVRRLIEAHQIAPNDPQLLRWLTYHFYTHRRYEKAKTYLSALETVSNDNYTKLLKDLLWRVENLVLWEDRFEREDSVDVGRGWLEEGERQGGLEWETVGGKLQVEDKAKSGGDAFLLREEGRLFRIEAKVDISSLASGRVGVVFGTKGVKRPLQAWIAVWSDPKGGVWWNTGSAWMRSRAEQKEPYQTAGGTLTLALELADAQKSIWRVFVNGKKVAEIEGDSGLGGTKVRRAGLFIRTIEGEGGKAIFSWVRIYRRKKE